MEDKKIVFVKFGSFSHTNSAVKRILKANFSGFEVMEVDIAKILKGDFFSFLLLNFFGLKEYGVDIFTGRKKLKVYRWRTEFLCRFVKKWMEREFSQREDIAFTIQTQSLFDASVSGTPHFLYTDHTLLANLDYPGIDFDQYQYSQGWRNLEKSFYHNSTCVFTMSTNVSNSLVKYYDLPTKKVKCVGVGANAFEGIDEASFPIKTDQSYDNKNILFVGTMWELKGGPELLEAFIDVQKKIPEAELHIVGVSPEIENKNVFVHGRLPLEKVAQFYSEASVFCMPSKGDAFGIVFLEAFFNRVPVVALNIGAAPDIIINDVSGFLIEPGDQRRLSESLSVLLGNPEMCKKFGSAGFESIYPKYTWKTVGNLLREYILSYLG